MAISLDQLLYGIRQVESNGRYGVVNSIGAVGAYQVMKANIPSWTKKALGYSMTWQQFRDSPSAQDKVARVILGGYYAKYGAEGAASMWFSGQPNPNSTASDGGNTVRQYVNKVIAASGGGTISGSSAGSSGGGGTTPVTPRLDSTELAEQYGLSAALINSNKELKRLFSQAVAGQWSAARFQASLRNTKWWSTQSDSLRKYVTLKYTDPASWNQNFGNAEAKINALAVQVGLGTQFAGGRGSKILQEATFNSLALGWSDARIKDWLGQRVQMHDGGMWGEAGETFDKLHELAYLNGLRYGGTWMQDAARLVASGRTTIQDFENRIRTTAAARYSAYADQIRAGQNVMDLAAPYIKAAASILELNEADVDLFNSHVAKAMTATPAKGGAAGSQMPLWQYENELRQDPLWRKTNNAREGLMTVAHQVAKDFGMAF